MTYTDAMTYCANFGAKLAEPKSDAENDAIKSYSPCLDTWIGVSDGLGSDTADRT